MRQAPGSDIDELSFELEREIARNKFLIALLEIERSGIKGSPVDGNPLQLLRQEIWPTWHDAMYPKHDATCPNLRGARRKPYPGVRGDIEKRNSGIAEGFDQWAEKCRLVELDKGGALRPAGWAVKFAYESCKTWSKEKLGIPSGPPWWVRANQSSSPVDLESSTVTASYVSFHVDDLSRRPGESRKQHKRRFLKAASARFEQICGCGDFGAPAGFGGRTKPRKKVDEAESDPLQHYKWLILYQCCGWEQSKIAKPPYQRTKQAISAGLRSAANAIGLDVREQTVKKKAQRSVGIGPQAVLIS